MTINQKPPFGNRTSLIERAASTYGLQDAVMRRDQTDSDLDRAAAEWAARNASPANSAPVQSPPQAQPVYQPAPVAQPIVAALPPVMAPTPMPVAPPPAAAVAPAPVQAPVQPPVMSHPVAAAAPAVAQPVPQRTAPVDIAMLKDAGFIVPGSPPSIISEEYRLIKRQVLIQAFGAPNAAALPNGNIILVCSAHPNDGKSFSSVNLALSMVSETDVEVLLIDADVAKPEVLSMLGLPAGPGLMDALTDPTIDPETLVMRTNIPGLLVLPAGKQTHNDTELLASQRTRALITRLAEGHPRRIIIFDSAPVLAASPASALALMVGQVIMVVRADITSEADLREAIGLLEGDARIQLMLNGVTFNGSGKRLGSYYGLGDK